ncbi:MAG: DUF2284 domain-containing protein [Roseburia sp.]|nr:DUF2284 domain-containing protein [Roseburia sp.]
MDCRIEYFRAEIPVAGYVARYRNEPRFEELCSKCPNYGRRWGCPPFDSPLDPGKYTHSFILAAKITPLESGLPLGRAQEILRPVRAAMEKELLELESAHGGLAFGFAGGCDRCGDRGCTRTQGLPCRHPESVRPSLEAVGFDISRTVADLFGIEIVWGSNHTLPPYLTLVSGWWH